MLSERAECGMMAENVEQGKTEPVVETQQKKRKRHFEDEGETATEKKKKKKKLEGYKSVHHETPENEELHFTRLSSEDVEYGTILENLKETYLKEAEGDFNSEAYKKKKKKHKLHTDTNEGRETVTEVTEDPEHAYEGNGGEVVHFPDRAKKKNKKKQEEKLVREIPGLMTDVELYKASAKQLEESFTSSSFSTQDNLYTCSTGSVLTSNITAFPGTNLQKADFNINDLCPKAKKQKVKKHDSHTDESLDVQSKAKTSDSSQEFLIGNNLEYNSDNRDQNRKAKKKKRKEHDSNNKELLTVQSENDKFTVIEKSSGHEKSMDEHGLGSHTQSRDEEQVELVPTIMELVNRAESFIPTSPSRHDDLYATSTSSVLTSSIAALPVANNQEADFYMKDVGPKTKRKRMTKCNSHNKELLDDQNESRKSISKEESSVGLEKSAGEQSLGSLTGNGDEEQGRSVPSVVDLLNRVKSMLNVKSPKKHKKEKGNKKHSGISDELKTSSKPPHSVKHRKGTKHDYLKLDKNTSNEKSTQKDSSKSYAGITDGLVSNERQSKIKISENKDVGSVNASTLLKNVLVYSNSLDGTKSDESDSHVSAVLHEVEKESDNVSLKSHSNKKQHKTKKSKNKASISFDPAAMLAEYMSKFDHSEGIERDNTADACQSSMEDAVDTENKNTTDITTSNTNFRSSFSLTGAGMANAQDRKRKKMNKGKGDAMPLQRSLPLLSLSHSYSEADRSVGQEIVRSNSIESLNEFLKSPSPVTALPRKSDSGNKVRKTVSIYENGILLTPEKGLTQNEVARSLQTGSSNLAEKLIHSKEKTGSDFSLSSLKQVASPEKTPSKSILSQRIASDVCLSTSSPSSHKAAERKVSKQESAVNSRKMKDQILRISSGVTHILKTPSSDKGNGSGSEGELINTSSILPDLSVLQSLKSPSGDSGMPAWMPKVSPVKAKPVNEVSTNSVQETRSTEMKSKHKTKKHKEKKSKIKDNKGREHKEKEQKKKNVIDCKDTRETRIENGLEIQKNLVARKEDHEAEKTKRKDTEGKPETSKEKDTDDTLEDLKSLASKLFSSFLQQGK